MLPDGDSSPIASDLLLVLLASKMRKHRNNPLTLHHEPFFVFLKASLPLKQPCHHEHVVPVRHVLWRGGPVFCARKLLPLSHLRQFQEKTRPRYHLRDLELEPWRHNSTVRQWVIVPWNHDSHTKKTIPIQHEHILPSRSSILTREELMALRKLCVARLYQLL